MDDVNKPTEHAGTNMIEICAWTLDPNCSILSILSYWTKWQDCGILRTMGKSLQLSIIDHRCRYGT